MLRAKKIMKLRQIVDISGVDFNDVKELASLMGMLSLRKVNMFVDLIKQRLTVEEGALLRDYWCGRVTPTCIDPYSDMFITPDFQGFSGPLLMLNGLQELSLYEAKGKQLYKCFVKVLNKKVLNGRPDNVWRDKLSVEEGCNPSWRVLYKPPLTKKQEIFSGRFYMAQLLLMPLFLSLIIMCRVGVHLVI